MGASDGMDAVRAALAAFDRAGPARHPLERYVYAGFKVGLASDMLVKVDRMSMASSLEVRVPLLDHVLVEYVGRLPLERRFSWRHLKQQLRDVVRDALPKEIVEGPKHGFTVPLDAWFKEDLVAYAREVFTDAETRRNGFVDADALAAVLDGKSPRPPRWSTLLWSLLMLELWRRHAGVTA